MPFKSKNKTDQELIQHAAIPADGHVSQPSLTRADWLEAAINIFVAEGIAAVRITDLSKMLSVSRGSFYWHFQGREDLLNGIISYWERKNARSVVLALSEAPSLEEGILSLFSTWIEPNSYDPGLDQAMRDWARRDEAIHAAVQAADRKCLEAITAFFVRMGLPRLESEARARTVYFCQIGYYALNLDEPLELRISYLEDSVYIFCGKRLSAEAVAEYRARHGVL